MTKPLFNKMLDLGTAKTTRHTPHTWCVGSGISHLVGQVLMAAVSWRLGRTIVDQINDIAARVHEVQP